MVDYINQLRRARERVGMEIKDLETIEQKVAVKPTKREGLMARPQPSAVSQPQKKTSPDDVWSDLARWSASLAQKRKPLPQAAPSVKQEAGTPMVEEDLGVPQEDMTLEERESIQQSLNQMAAVSNTVRADIPANIREDKAFMSEVNRLAGKYKTSADAILGVMSFETGSSFDPSKRNTVSGATGLIQFLPSTAKALGTTTEKLAAMSRAQQMRYVEKYFDQFNLDAPTDKDLYMAVLWPKAIGKSDDFVLFTEGTKAYEQNSGLDRNKDGKVTKAEAAARAVA